MQPAIDRRRQEPGNGQRTQGSKDYGEGQCQAALPRIRKESQVGAVVVEMDQPVADPPAHHGSGNGPERDQEQVVAAEQAPTHGRAFGFLVEAGAHPPGAQRSQHEDYQDDGRERERLESNGQPEEGDRRVEIEANDIEHGPQCTGRENSRSPSSVNGSPECRPADTGPVAQALHRGRLRVA